MEELATIFIPTHNRHSLLLRNLAWLEQSRCQIVIADSSNTSLIDEINSLSSRSSFKGRINYLHKNNLDYYTKINAGLSLIDTHYTIMCPDDDFIIWQNIKYLVAEAIRSNAQTVVARDLSIKRQNNTFKVSESSEYRRFGIKNHSDTLNHIKSGMFPIVCTYHQLYKTSMIQDLWSHMEKNKSFMPGNKLAELVFRAGCFINGPVVYCDKIFRVLGDQPSLRTYDSSQAVRKYTLNFWEEVKYLQENGMFPGFLDVIASYLTKHHPAYKADSEKLVLDLIINPMLRRMTSKHEILWKSRYSLGFDFSSNADKLERSKESLKYIFGMKSDIYRCPEYFSNLNSYFLSSEDDWSSLVSLLHFLNDSM